MNQQTMNVAQAMQLIDYDELFLPAIQRDFVWSPERIQNYLDSLLRGYPTGVFLFWNTKARVQYRRFVPNRAQNLRHSYQVKEDGQRGIMVLDGQQRLQSLYVALKGRYDDRQLYFDILGSGQNDQNTAKARFRFAFLTDENADKRNDRAARKQFWLPFKDIFACKSIDDYMSLVDQLHKRVQVDQFSVEGKRILSNVTTSFSKMKLEEVLSFYTIDRGFGEDKDPTPVEEILEIFVRINSGGQVLSRSDLMFSLLKLKWEGAGESIDSLVEEINANRHGTFNFNNDFVLRCALVCCDKGARYDVNKLRSKATIDQLENAFPRVGKALVACIDFLVREARILDHRILGSPNSLIPFVYFFYHQDKQRLQGEGARRNMKVALYLSLMTRVFTRFSDSRIDGVVNNVLKPAFKQCPGEFPLAEFRTFVHRRQGRYRFDNWLLQNNKQLLMNILNHGTILAHAGRHRPEYDHIFPQSKLRAHGYSKDQINEFANLRLISKTENIWKSNIDPETYFTEHSGVAAEYLMPADMLSYDDYPDFLLVRREKIWEQVIAFLGLRQEEYINDSRLPIGYENKAIDDLEIRLRDFIDEQLSEHVDGEYWKRSMPAGTQIGVKQRIEGQLKNNTGLTWGDFASSRSRLDFCDMSDYEMIIAAGNNWPIFDNYFKNKLEFQRHMSAVVRFRNGIKHNREVHQVERLTGEAGIIWLREALGVTKPIAPAPTAAVDVTAEASGTPERPKTADEREALIGEILEDDEAILEILTRLTIPPGQLDIYNLFTNNPDKYFSRQEIADAIRNSDAKSMGGVFMAFGRRIGASPDPRVRSLKPYNALFFHHRRRGGETLLRIRGRIVEIFKTYPQFYDYLTGGSPSWLAEEFGSAHWKNSQTTHRMQMEYFGFWE